MTQEEEIIIAAENMQKERHTFIDDLINKNKKVDYDSANTTYFSLKLAEIFIRLKKLEDGNLQRT